MLDGLYILLAKNANTSSLVGAIAFLFFFAGFCLFAGVLFVAAGMNRERRNTTAGKIAIGTALALFSVIAVPLAYFLWNVLGAGH